MSVRPPPETEGGSGPVLAFWCRIPSRPNFGDALTPWIVKRISGRYPRFVRPDDPREKLFAVGSILEFTGPRCTVWGSGILARDDPVSPAARLLAVRGPLSRDRALECGTACPSVFGDPALLLPRLYRPPTITPHGVGLVAHYADKPRIERRSLGVRLIDVQDPVESVIDQIVSCEVIASSSLHGLIASHAYGVPAVWVKFRDPPHGDDSKFVDHYRSLGLDPPQPYRLDEQSIDARDLRHRAQPPPPLPDLSPLIRCCPFGVPQ
jgi:pyruvyltransferase